MNKEGQYALISLLIVLIIGSFLIWSYKSQDNQAAVNVNTNNAVQSSSDSTTAQASTSLQSSPNKSLILDIATPQNESTVDKSLIELKGKTTPGAFIEINENDVVVTSTGDFVATINLVKGDNIIIVTASDEWGNTMEKELIVTYESLN